MSADGSFITGFHIIPLYKQNFYHQQPCFAESDSLSQSVPTFWTSDKKTAEVAKRFIESKIFAREASPDLKQFGELYPELRAVRGKVTIQSMKAIFTSGKYLPVTVSAVLLEPILVRREAQIKRFIDHFPLGRCLDPSKIVL